MKRARTVKIILSILALFVAAGSQAAVAEISSTPGWYVEGTQPNEKFCMINAAGDVNRDGYADVLVGAPSNGLGYVSLFCGSPSGLSTKPSWTVVNNQDGAWFGFNCVGDFNGDGYLDVAIGAPYYNNGKSNAGRVYIYYGSASGLSTTANLIIEGNQAGAFFGWFFQEHFVGDLNKDGYDDIIIPSWGYNNSAGQISVYYGSATGLSDVPGWTVSGDQAGGTFGKACIAGDINGDGYLDVIVGAEGYNNGLSGAGRVYVYYGAPSGLNTTPSLIIEGNQAGAHFGSSTAPAGDVNGDGYDDVIVASYWYNNGLPQEGAAFVYFGSPTGLNANNYSIVSSGTAGASVGWVNKVGDVNFDGYDDIIIGSPWEGKARLFLGSEEGLIATPFWTAQSSPHFGWPCGSAGDVNGDGVADIYVGDHTYAGYTGRAYVYYGSCDAACWKKAYDRVKAELDDCRNPTTTTTIPPTLIEMSSLTATPANQKVKLEWKTESEIDNAGFNVWRAEGFQKVNPSLIPTEGSPVAGADYDFVDDLVFNGKQYIYLIEDMDNGGISTFHGPVKAVPRMIYGLGK